MTSLRPSAPLEPAAGTFVNGQVAGHFAHDGYTIVWAHGEIDVATAPDLRQELAEAVRAHQCRVIVDLTQVTFMDSTGLNALVFARRRAAAGNGDVRLVGACPMIRKVLRVTGLDNTFPVHATIEESISPGAVHNGTVVQLPAQAEFRG